MENNNKGGEKYSGYFSKKLRAGKRRTYFFDVRATKGQDYYITITESKKRQNQNGYDSHKIFLYKEDFKAFVDSLNEALGHIKSDLMPEFDFENYNREAYYAMHEDGRSDYEEGQHQSGGHRENHREQSRQSQPKSEAKQGFILDDIDRPRTPDERATSGDNLADEEVDKW